MEIREYAEKADAVVAAKRRERESIEILGSLLAGWLQSPTFEKVLLSVLRNVLSTWSDGSRTKQKISDLALKLAVEKITPQPLSHDGIDAQKVGRLLTVLAQHLNDLQTQNPMHLADNLEGPLCEFIASTDFGEVKELVDRAEEPIVELVRRLMGFVWNTYPAKFGMVISLVHPLGNIIVRSLKEIVKPLNGVSPDLFTDLIFTIVRSIDGRQIGELVNAVLEMVRQLHTGSLLQGEAGVPQFQMDLTQKLREIMSGIDPELLLKIKVITAEFAEERANAVSDILDENPELVLDLVSRYSSLKNPSIRSKQHRLRVYEHLSEGEFATAVAKGLSEIDTQEISEIFNTLMRMFNTVHAEKPDFFPRLLSDLFMNIDTDALKTATEWFMRDIIGGLKPIAGEVLPVLLKGISELNRYEEAGR
jgi:hypothetical protein